MMNWLERKIFQYNVTVGLYMLDWWERYLINTLLGLIIWFLVKQVKSFSLKLLVLIVGVLCRRRDKFCVLYPVTDLWVLRSHGCAHTQPSMSRHPQAAVASLPHPVQDASDVRVDLRHRSRNPSSKEEKVIQPIV